MAGFILVAFGDKIAADLDVQMDELDKVGIKGIELRTIGDKNIADLSLIEAYTLKQKLNARDFFVAAIASPIGKVSITEDFEAEFKRFKHVVALAKIMATNYIRMFSFYLPEDAVPETYQGEVIRRWQQFAAYAKEYNVVLLHENEKKIFGDNAVRCLTLLQVLNTPHVRATFDPANFIQVGQDPLAAYALLKDYVAYVHMKDATAEGEVVPVREGTGQIQTLLQTLLNDGYEGCLSIEPHLKQYAPLEGFEKAVAALKAIVEQLK